MKPYSNDLPEKIIAAYQNGDGSLRAIAKRFSVSLNFVGRLVERFRKTGRVDQKPPAKDRNLVSRGPPWRRSGSWSGPIQRPP